jgi:hypothetical protein
MIIFIFIIEVMHTDLVKTMENKDVNWIELTPIILMF